MNDTHNADIEVLREAAALIRKPSNADNGCHCEDDGETFTDHWFDRTICPEPCNTMHDICVECGRPKGGCAFAAEVGKPTPFRLALADWLESTANDVEHVHTPIYNLTSTTVARAVAVARTYLGERIPPGQDADA